MKRVALWAVVLLLTTQAFSEETRRYVVATRRAGGVAANDLAPERRLPPGRRVASFRFLDGFAADLTAAEVAELRLSSGVRWVEPVVERHLMADESIPGAQITPSGITQIKAPKAWAGRRAADVNVVVIDSGVDFLHPDLRRSWAGGTNLIAPGQPPMDDLGHGSHVAGTIAAGNNHAGVVGVAPGVRLWAIKAIDDTGSGTMEDVLLGIDWVLAKKSELGGRWVVNLSLGGEDTSELEREAFQKAADAGVVVVASTGNDSNSTIIAPVAYPAAYPSVLAVGAVSGTNVRAFFSNSGPELDLVAPGVGVLSTILSGFTFGSFVRTDDAVITARAMIGSKLQSISGRYVVCGLGAAGDFPPDVQGAIALIQRGGGDTFANKTRRAREAGAIGVAIYNNDGSNILFTLYPKEDLEAQTYPWPVGVGISLADGQTLAAKGGGRMTIGYESDDYGLKNGTSMSAPHVTGAVALLWSLAPEATPKQLIQALISTAKDLGDPGRDDLYGHGIIDLEAAARSIAPEAFQSTPRSGRRFLSRRSR